MEEFTQQKNLIYASNDDDLKSETPKKVMGKTLELLFLNKHFNISPTLNIKKSNPQCRGLNYV